jgi:hypothetical protein
LKTIVAISQTVAALVVTPADVAYRHANNADQKTGINRGRFTPGIDEIDHVPGDRTYG